MSSNDASASLRLTGLAFMAPIVARPPVPRSARLRRRATSGSRPLVRSGGFPGWLSAAAACCHGSVLVDAGVPAAAGPPRRAARGRCRARRCGWCGGRAAERSDEPGYERGEKHLSGQRLDHGDPLAAALRGGEVPVAESGERGEAEVLECLGGAGVAVSEELAPAEVVHGRVEGSEHQSQ